jgi:hypothetical protein
MGLLPPPANLTNGPATTTSLSQTLGTSSSVLTPMRFTQQEMSLFHQCHDFIATNPARLAYYQKIANYFKARDTAVKNAPKEYAKQLKMIFLPLFKGKRLFLLIPSISFEYLTVKVINPIPLRN